MLALRDHLQDVCNANQHNLDRIIEEIELNMLPIISTKRIKTQKKNNMQKDEVVVTCDLLFKEYRQRLDDTKSTLDDISSCYEKYQRSRDLLNATVLKQHENEYLHTINMNDDSKLWQKMYAIPKKGNLMLPMNYRGIQVQPLIGLLYDRILANRLIWWAEINYEQTALNKSTLNHIFTQRILIAMSKRYKKPLYQIL